MSPTTDGRIQRRELLRRGVAVGAGLMGAASTSGSSARAETPPREERFETADAMADALNAVALVP